MGEKELLVKARLFPPTSPSAIFTFKVLIHTHRTMKIAAASLLALFTTLTASTTGISPSSVLAAACSSSSRSVGPAFRWASSLAMADKPYKPAPTLITTWW